jgi:hypothetical protein
MTKHTNAAVDRFDEIIERLHADDSAIKLLNDLLTAAGHYLVAVVETESNLRIARKNLAGEDLRGLTSDLEASRSRAHNALIASLHAFNRYAVRQAEDTGDILPPGVIFSGNPDRIRDRVAIADWAGELLAGIYRRRHL